MSTTFWCLGLPDQDPPRAAATLKSYGVEHLTLGYKQTALAEAAHAAGLQVWLYSASFAIEGLGPECAAIGLDGKPKQWFSSGCPNNPVVRQAHLERVRHVVSLPYTAGYFLDGIRFASPNAGREEYFICFCDHCGRKAEELGFDWTSIRQDVAAFAESLAGGHALKDWQDLLSAPSGVIAALLYRPGVAAWLAFRQRCVLEHVRDVRETLKRTAPAKQLGAYIFAPAFSPLVGQSYPHLAPLIDTVQPMLYVNGPGDSTVSGETSSFARLWAGMEPDSATETAACAFALAFYGINPGSERTSFRELESEYPSHVIGTETRRARSRLGAAHLAPIIRLQESHLPRTVQAVQEADADGFSLFVLRSMEELPLVEQAVQAWRTG